MPKNRAGVLLDDADKRGGAVDQLRQVGREHVLAGAGAHAVYVARDDRRQRHAVRIVDPIPLGVHFAHPIFPSVDT